MIGAGWLLDRKFRLDLTTLVKLNIYFFVPAFIFVRVSARLSREISRHASFSSLLALLPPWALLVGLMLECGDYHQHHGVPSTFPPCSTIVATTVFR